MERKNNSHFSNSFVSNVAKLNPYSYQNWQITRCSYPNSSYTKRRKFQTWWRRWRRWFSFWDKTEGLNNASLQIRDRKLLLMQKAPLFFTLKYITYNKECRGFIILYSRYFSPWQDTELVAINLHMCVNALYKIFSCCLLRLLTAASTEVDKIVALSFLLKNFKFYYVACFYPFTCSLRR